MFAELKKKVGSKYGEMERKTKKDKKVTLEKDKKTPSKLSPRQNFISKCRLRRVSNMDYEIFYGKKRSGRLKFEEEPVEFPEEPIPDPPKRKTGMDTTKPPPPYWPSQIQRALEDLYRPSLEALKDLDEINEMNLYESDEATAPWTLSDLSMEAMQGFLNRKGKVYKNAEMIPVCLHDRFQQVLPVDIDIRRAIEIIGEGIYWKRRYIDSWPAAYPVKNGSSFKTQYVQRWFADYLGSLEPEYVFIKEVLRTTVLVSPWVIKLDIKQLNAPKYKFSQPPNPDALSDVDMDTCIKIRPYPKRLNLRAILPLLVRLEELEICFGFINYERHPGFSHARIRQKDIKYFVEGLKQCNKLKSIRIYMSAFYSSDLKLFKSYIKWTQHLRKLEISNCKLDDNAANLIAIYLLENRTLNMLSLKRNHITSEGIYVISQSLALKRKYRSPLKILDLSYNLIGNVGGVYLSCMLLVNTMLICLKLIGCEIADVGGMALAKALDVNRRLKRLDLTANELTNCTAEIVIMIMESNPVIEEIVVRGNEISEVTLQDISDLAKEKRMKRRKIWLLSRREKYINENKGTRISKIRKFVKLKKPWRAYDVSGNSSTFSDTDSGSLTTLGSHDSHEFESTELRKLRTMSTQKKVGQKRKHFLKFSKEFSKFMERLNHPEKFKSHKGRKVKVKRVKKRSKNQHKKKPKKQEKNLRGIIDEKLQMSDGLTKPEDITSNMSETGDIRRESVTSNQSRESFKNPSEDEE